MTSAVPRAAQRGGGFSDRKSTRLNSSHTVISYAVFCLKKKKNTRRDENKLAFGFSFTHRLAFPDQRHRPGPPQLIPVARQPIAQRTQPNIVHDYVKDLD